MAIQDKVFHEVLRAHEAIYKGTDGRVGHRLLGVPTLLLRTTGRRTGKTRTNALVYASVDGRYVVVPSNGGAKRAPGWFHNLKGEPGVEVQIGRERRPASVEVIESTHPDFARLWKAANDNNRNFYESYQAKTERRIPVVALTPI